MSYLRDNQSTFYNYSNSAAFYHKNSFITMKCCKAYQECLNTNKGNCSSFFLQSISIIATSKNAICTKGNWTESNTIIVLDRTEMKRKTFFYCTNSFIIIKVQLPIDNAQIKRNAVQVISFLPIMKNAIYKRDIVSKCKTTIIFD